MNRKIRLILLLGAALAALFWIGWLMRSYGSGPDSRSVGEPGLVTWILVLSVALLITSLVFIRRNLRLAKPARVLLKAMREFSSQGSLQKLPEKQDGLEKELYHSFNSMLESIEEKREEVQRETKRLRAINRLASLADFNFDQDKVAREALKVILSAVDLDYLAIYTRSDPEKGRLSLKYRQVKEEVNLPDLGALRDFQEIVDKTARINQIFVGQNQAGQPKSGTDPDLLSKVKPALVAIPLSNKGMTSGVVLGANFRRLFLDPNEMEIFSSLCQHLGVTLENFRLYQDLSERVIEVTTFNKIGQILSSILDLDQLLKELLQIVTTSFGYSVCAVLLYDEDKRELASRALWGYPKEIEEEGIHLPVPGPGLSNWVLQKGEPVLVNNVLEDSRYWQGWPECRSELAVPLKSGDQVLGVLNVESERVNAFTEKDLRILTTLAGEISILIQNARHFQEERDRTQQLLVADQINRAITSTLDLNQIFEIVYQGLQEFIGQDGMYFYFYNPKEQSFDRAYYIGSFDTSTTDELARIPAASTNMAWVVQNRQVFVCNDLQEGKYQKAIQEHLYRMGMRSYILVPILDQEHVVGCFNAVSRTSHKFGKRKIEIARTVANHLAVAIKNSGMYQELKDAYDDLKSAQQTLLRSEKLKTLGEMTSGIVHDFNNLLATILGRTQILLQKLNDADLTHKDTWLRSLKAMEKAALDGSQLLSRISQFGKAGTESNLEPVQLNEVVADSIELTRPRWKDQSLHEGIQIAVRTKLESAGKILADPAELREVLMNLIINAVDALPRGGEIMLQTGENERQVWVKVKDNGTGMSPEVNSKIFQPFFTTKGKKGTGLGLAICLSIVTRFKGEIKLESEIGQGSTFTLYFPKLVKSESPFQNEILGETAITSLTT